MSAAGTVNSSAIPSQYALRMQQAFKLALSTVLLYWLALWVNWDMPKYGALAIALISLDTTGASLHKGLMRIVGTTVGLAVGLLGLALFAQDSWLTLAYHAIYLVIIGNFMPTSRYPYAWYVAGFLPTLVWATTYGKVDNAFHYAVFRYLETTAGVVIYTLVCVIFWPRQAGDKLNGQGLGLSCEIQNLFRQYCGQLKDGRVSDAAPAMRAKLAGMTSQLLATLEVAYADTSSVVSQRRAWECFRVNVCAMGDALELWRQSIADCRRLELERLLPQLPLALETLERRLARIESLWQVRAGDRKEDGTASGDQLLLKTLELEVNRSEGATLAHLDRAALLSFVQHLNVVDRTSCEVFRTMRVLAGLAPIHELAEQSLPQDLYRQPSWDVARLLSGLLPAVSLVVGYMFWIHFNPPTGPSVPNMAVTFGLLVVMTPMRALVLLPVLLVAMWAFVAPVYFFVMPRLSTGAELLSLIFGFVFAASVLLVGRLAPLKTMVLVLFAMMTGISNQQNYSFMGLVDAAQMMLLAIGVVAVVQTLFARLQPEQTMLSSVRRFFSGCARVIGGLANAGPAAQAKKRRVGQKISASMLSPLPRRILAAQEHLDFKLHPDVSPEKMQRFADSLQDIVYRLQAMEIACGWIAVQSPELADSLVVFDRQMQESVERVFESWANFEMGEASEIPQEQLQQFSQNLEQQFELLDTSYTDSPQNDRRIIGHYALLGSVRGLIEAMLGTQGIVRQINWQQWATPRF